MEQPDAIVIRYDGLDAESHRIDLGMLGQSLQGAARLLAVAGNIALTGQYVSKVPAMRIRVLALPPQANCFELPVAIVEMLPALPLLSPIGRALAKKAAIAFVNYILAKNANQPKEADKALDVALAAIEANKEVTLKALDVADAAVKAANDQRPASRQFATPVGHSVGTAIIGPRVEAFVIDAPAKEQIDREDATEIGRAQSYTVSLSELDIKTGSCKVALYGEGDGRIPAEIADPLVRQPRNPYSTALDAQGWIRVVAKPHLRAGRIEKLTISDVATQQSA